MQAAGFEAPRTTVILHMPISRPALEVLASGGLDQNTTSQLLILGEPEYAAGVAKIRADALAARARGETLMLNSDLRLYATRASC